jgi:hypothetical protein
MIKAGKFVFGLSLVAALVACGGGTDTIVTTTLAAANATQVIDTTTGPAVVASVLGQTFTFPAVTKLGTTAATTVALAGTAAAPTFAIGSAGSTASGALSFGSCKFTITASTFPAGHALALTVPNTVITVNPCSFTATTSGKVADGTTKTVPVTMSFEGTTSSPINLPVSIAADGTVTLNGTTLTTKIGTSVFTGVTGGN